MILTQRLTFWTPKCRLNRWVFLVERCHFQVPAISFHGSIPTSFAYISPRCHVCFTLHQAGPWFQSHLQQSPRSFPPPGLRWEIDSFQGSKNIGVLHRNTVLPGWEKKIRWEQKSHMEKTNLGEKIWWQSILPDGNERKNGEKSWSFNLENLDFAWKRWKKWLKHTPWN